MGKKERHGYQVRKEWICVTPGIVPALHWAVRTPDRAGRQRDGVHAGVLPVYERGKNSGERRLVECELKKPACSTSSITTGLKKTL